MAATVSIDGDHVLLTEVAPATEIEVTLKEGAVPEVQVRLSPSLVEAILTASSAVRRVGGQDLVSSFFDRRFGVKIDAPDGLDFEAPAPETKKEGGP